MRIFFILISTMLLTGCTNEANKSRNYIISQQKENIEKETQ
jgi:outer membrane biogenesis lipoprotein LolB